MYVTYHGLIVNKVLFYPQEHLNMFNKSHHIHRSFCSQAYLLSLISELSKASNCKALLQLYRMNLLASNGLLCLQLSALCFWVFHFTKCYHFLCCLSLWVSSYFNSLLLSQTRRRRIQNKWLYQGATLYPEYWFTVLHSSFKCLTEIISTLETLHNEAGDSTIFLKNKPLFFILINTFSFLHIWSYISGDLIPFTVFGETVFQKCIDSLCLCVIFIHWMGINAHKIGTCTTLTKLLRVFAYASGAKTEASLVSFYDQRYVRDSQKWAICTVFLFSF